MNEKKKTVKLGVARFDAGYPNNSVKPHSGVEKDSRGRPIVTKGSVWVLPDCYEFGREDNLFDELKKKTEKEA